MKPSVLISSGHFSVIKKVFFYYSKTPRSGVKFGSPPYGVPFGQSFPSSSKIRREVTSQQREKSRDWVRR